jgi:predicted nucleotidyltransferase
MTGHNLIDGLREDASRNTLGFAVLTFGSHAYGNYTDTSDLDLFFISSMGGLDSVIGTDVLRRLSFEDESSFNEDDVEQLRRRSVDLCQINQSIRGIPADIHLTTVETLNDGFLGPRPRKNFWNRFKQPLTKDYLYTLATFSGGLVTYKAAYRDIAAECYEKESPSLLDLENGDVSLGHLLDKLLTSVVVYDRDDLNVTNLVTVGLWRYFARQVMSYRARRKVQADVDAGFEFAKSLFFRSSRFSPPFIAELKNRFASAVSQDWESDPKANAR